MGVPGASGVTGERGPVGPKGNSGPPGRLFTLKKSTKMLLCYKFSSLHNLYVLQVSVGYKATRALPQLPSDFQERGALQDRRVSEDHKGLEGHQGHEASLAMQVSYDNKTFVVKCF